MSNKYTDLQYPQPISAPALVPDFEAHFQDPTAISGVNSQIDNNSGIFDGGLSVINNSGVVTPLSVVIENISGVDLFGNEIIVDSGVVSFLRPRYIPSLGSNIYRASGLSNSHEQQSQDFIFNKYIHYMPNPQGGRGLLDKTAFAVETDVTYSRNIKINTYSPYSGRMTVSAATTTQSP